VHFQKTLKAVEDKIIIGYNCAVQGKANQRKIKYFFLKFWMEFSEGVKVHPQKEDVFRIGRFRVLFF